MMTDLTFGMLARARRKSLNLSRGDVAARLGTCGHFPATGLSAEVLEELETRGTVHVGGYVSARLAAALEIPAGDGSPLYQALLDNVAGALSNGFLSVRAATRILKTTEEDLQEALELNGVAAPMDVPGPPLPAEAAAVRPSPRHTERPQPERRGNT